LALESDAHQGTRTRTTKFTIVMGTPDEILETLTGPFPDDAPSDKTPEIGRTPSGQDVVTVQPQMLSPGMSHRDEPAHSWHILTFDVASIVGLFPDRQPWA